MQEGMLKTRHLVLSEKRKNDIGCRIVGSAFRMEEGDHFTLHLRILPGITFFIVKNKKGFPEYVVFSGRALKNERQYRFFHRIGSGYEDKIENILSLSIPDLGQIFHVQLETEDLHFVEPAA